MSEKGTLYIVIGAVVIGLLVIFSKQQAVQTQVALGQKQIIPQASQNYGGYLAASTAPAVSSALSGFLTGLGNLTTSWFHGSNPPQTASPSAAQPQGAQQYNSGGVGVNMPLPVSVYGATAPVVISDTSYDNTTGSAFNYGGLAADNSFDPLYSLDPATTDVYAS